MTDRLVEVHVAVAAAMLLTPACRRAFSTRIRRIASAAAAKKCPRLSQCWAFSTSTSRMYASCTSAVACSVCPGFSWASLAAASFRSSSYTSGNSCSAADGIAGFDLRQDLGDVGHEDQNTAESELNPSAGRLRG